MSGDTGSGFTVVDVETSGLSAGVDRVLSIAAIQLDERGRRAQEFYTLLDPGCDPGPVHIHGLTRQKLHGSPRFEHIHPHLSSMLTGRVMVAHNARFDYDFLAGEFRRAGAVLPVRQRLCTLALARRVALPTPDYRLGTLAAHYRVTQRDAHNALDDTRVLVGVLSGLISDADRLGIVPPLLSCPPRGANRQVWRDGPKPPCPYENPGRFTEGGALVQGMKIAITGDTRCERTELVTRAEAAGLDVTGNVSRLTGLLVANDPAVPSTKATKARDYDTPILTEARFLQLLDHIQPGIRKDAAAQPKPPAPKPDPAAPRPEPSGPLSGRRILVLGGSHDESAEIRKRITELGGSAAVNLSAGVTDILLLPGSDTDPRRDKAATLGLPTCGPDLLDTPGSEPPTSPLTSETATPAQVLAHGQVTDLPITARGGKWTLRTSWLQTTTAEVDLVAFLVDDNHMVTTDEDFVFYNQPETPGARLTLDGPTEQSLDLDLESLPTHCRRIVLAAALHSETLTFAHLGPIELEADPGPESGPFARATLDAATEERTLVLAEIYLRQNNWRLRAIGQGYPTNLATLARHYGVDIAD